MKISSEAENDVFTPWWKFHHGHGLSVLGVKNSGGIQFWKLEESLVE